MNKALVFDLGGVLVEFTGIEPLIELSQGSLTAEEARRFWLFSAWIRKFESGQCSAREFATGVVSELQLTVTPEEFLEEFGSWEKGPFSGALELLGALRRQFFLACLSNNNVFHWQTLREKSNIDQKFHRCYLSYEIGLLKPDKEVFEYMLADIGFPAQDILYFDDNHECVETALSLGLQAYQVNGAESVCRVLKEQNIEI